MTYIPFNRPYITGKEMQHILQTHCNGKLGGGGEFTRRCEAWFHEKTQSQAFLTHSCGGALEIAAILLGIKAGDEILMPSFTSSSMANAFIARDAVPVFVDIREDTLNIDEQLLEAAVTSRTKAIAVSHYAGVACEMDMVLAVAQKYELRVIEDASYSIFCSYKERALGTIGDAGALCFSEDKNIHCGEGGALLVNLREYAGQARRIRDNGLDATDVWQSSGGAYIPSELQASFLYGQCEAAESIMAQRMKLWNQYHRLLLPLETRGLLFRPHIPSECQHNASIYYILLEHAAVRSRVIESLTAQHIHAEPHYIPLHSAPAGLRYGRMHGAALRVTDRMSERLLRLPLWIGLTKQDLERIVSVIAKVLTASDS